MVSINFLHMFYLSLKSQYNYLFLQSALFYLVFNQTFASSLLLLNILLLQPRRSNGPQEGYGISVTIGVADEHIGAVVGRAGRNIIEISQVEFMILKYETRCFLLLEEHHFDSTCEIIIKENLTFI